VTPREQDALAALRVPIIPTRSFLIIHSTRARRFARDDVLTFTLGGLSNPPACRTSSSGGSA
jgi:hypothetical protein